MSVRPPSPLMAPGWAGSEPGHDEVGAYLNTNRAGFRHPINFLLDLRERDQDEGRLRSRIFCSPVSTSSPFWLCTVTPSVTTPVERCGVSAAISSIG